MIAAEINTLFKEAGRTVGSVESFTGGLFAREVTRVPGASKVFKGALVTYATEEKVRILGISKNLIDRVGVVSQEVAGEIVAAYDTCQVFKYNLKGTREEIQNQAVDLGYQHLKIVLENRK